MPDQPLVSVVVSTHNRPDRLARLLASLREQSLPASDFEVVVVDDGSGPETARLLEEEAGRDGLALRSLRNEQPAGPGGGRNRGWRAAHAPLVAFTDDDCVAEPGWLAALLEAQQEYPQAVLQGATTPDDREMPQDNRLLTRSVTVSHLGPQFETCNIAYPRDLLDTLGGFDESYGLRPGGEDTDLAWRALELGHLAVFVPGAAVRHAVVQLGVGGAFRDAWRWGECAQLFARHPGARSMLYRGLFWNVWHYLLFRSLLALVTPYRIRVFLLNRHLMALRRRAGVAGAGVWWIPFLLAYDAVEAASMVRGALRHRTPLL